MLITFDRTAWRLSSTRQVQITYPDAKKNHR
jgi:hypothetical protein